MNAAMPISRGSSLLETRWGYLAVMMIGTGIFLSVFMLPVPYSYWLDELYSVTGSNESLASLRVLLLGDVHPPLYQILLKLWVFFLGDGEFATRSLSWLFATGGLVLIYQLSSKHGHLFVISCLLFFATNKLFVHYSNETRSYAMALFFSALLITNYPYQAKKTGNLFLVSCILLSLTHYFGLFLAGVALLVCFAQNINHPRFLFKIVLTGVVCLVWPVYHLLSGDLLTKTGGGFWIQVNGVIDSFKIAASGYVSRLGQFGAYVLWAGIILSAWLSIYSLRQKTAGDRSIEKMTLTVCMITAVFLILIAAIDIWAPMSTTRNYIVLLPLLGLLVGGSITLACRLFPRLRVPTLSLFFVFCALNLVVSYFFVSDKPVSNQDWKGASSFLVDHADGKNLYYTTHAEDNEWRRLIANFYVLKASQHKLRLDAYEAGITEIKRPALILFGHDHRADLIEAEMERLGGKQLYANGRPIHVKKGSAGVYSVD